MLKFPKKQYKKEKTEFQKAVKRLDTIFSKYIRTRESFNDMNICFTCGTVKFIKQLDCGHYIGRQYYGTRWNEQNCQPQCTTCNYYNEGEKDIFEKKIDLKYGAGTAEKLKIMGRHKYNKKPSLFDLEYMTKEYREKYKRLKH